MQTYMIKSENLLRSYNESHVGEALATAANPVDIVKDIMPKGVPYKTREIAVFYEVPKGGNNVVVPVRGTAAAAAIASSTFPLLGSAVFSFVTISPTVDMGVDLEWNRAFAQQAQWSVMSEFVQTGIEGVEQALMSTMVGALIANKGSTFALSGTLTWKNFCDGITAVATKDYKCDKVICGPTLYGELLQLQQFVDASYVGTDSNIASGVLRTQLGADIIMTTDMPATVMLFIDSKHALGCATNRDGLVEEYAYPKTDQYGIVVSSKYGVAAKDTLAIVYAARA
jgi:hypothetical protein